VTGQLPLVISALATGSIYALIALGFVVVFRASGALNFAHVGVMLLGGYVTFQVSRLLELGFVLGVLVAAVVAATAALIIYLTVARPLAGRPVMAVAIATIGIDIAIRGGIGAYRPWATEAVEVGSPWGADTSVVLGVSVFTSHLWVIGTGAVVVVGLVFAIERSRWGLWFRAVAEDEEAAAATGVPVRRVLVGAWMLAGLLAALAGAMVGTFPRLLQPASADFAFRAIPAVVIGGLNSVTGAIVGGLLVGFVEVYTAGYAPSALGVNVHLVAPYALMLGVLLWRAEGLFGTPDVRRL
jgi:branched-chain amino acid transport system permease protein